MQINTNDSELLSSNAHISDEEIRDDIVITRKEILQLDRKIRAAESGIKGREDFVNKLIYLLNLRKEK